MSTYVRYMSFYVKTCEKLYFYDEKTGFFLPFGFIFISEFAF